MTHRHNPPFNLASIGFAIGADGLLAVMRSTRTAGTIVSLCPMVISFSAQTPWATDCVASVPGGVNTASNGAPL